MSGKAEAVKTHSQGARRATTEYPIRLCDAPFPPCSCATTCAECTAARALDVVVEAFDDVTGGRCFEVLGLYAEDGVFQSELRDWVLVGALIFRM
jgi:hypothetical protein